MEIQAVLVDDASNDGTADAVSAKFAWVEVFRTSGDLFWARGMAQAQALARKYRPDFYLWINDDTHVVPDALQRLLASYQVAASANPIIVVGSTIDQKTKACTYGGLYAPHRYKIFNFRRLIGHTVETECDAMNGNFVLVPSAIVETIGGIDPIFAHGMGDIDYAMRAREAGFKVISAPGWHGYCSNNSAQGTYSDTTLPLLVRWKKMLSRKGLPVKSWLTLTSRHGGLFWPIYFLWPYARFWCAGILGQLFSKK